MKPGEDMFPQPQSSFYFLKMPFGLINAAATFNKMVHKLLKGLDYLDSCLDDILCHTPTGEFRRLFEKLKGSHLTVKPSKCQVGFNNLTFIGNHISELGIKPEECKILDILMVLQRSKYAVSWDFSAVAPPLSDLTKKGQPKV